MISPPKFFVIAMFLVGFFGSFGFSRPEFLGTGNFNLVASFLPRFFASIRANSVLDCVFPAPKKF